ncbi:hypothetical protein G6F22_016990 [Rhizopus arrhizus]|nr:hypothetical protein G6F22_016990 [Rhizopus arrhizus]
MAGAGQQGYRRGSRGFRALRGRILVNRVGPGTQRRTQRPRVQATDPNRAAAEFVVQAGDQATQAMLGHAIAAPVGLPDPLRGVDGKHQGGILTLPQQRQAGLGQPRRGGQGDVHRAGETGRIGQFERGQSGKVCRTDQQAIQPPQFALKRLGQFGIVVRACSFHVQRVQQRFRANGLDLGVDPIQPARLASQQHHRGAGGCSSHRRGTAQATARTGNQHHAIL